MRRSGTTGASFEMRARRWVLLGSALLAPWIGPARAQSDGESVRLDILNAGVGTRLHCILVLAHFVTLEAGGENVLCGVSGDWSDTRGDVPIQGLRDGSRRWLGVECALDGRLRCRPPDG